MIMHFLRRFVIAIVAALTGNAYGQPNIRSEPPDSFNEYVLKAVAYLSEKYPAEGYGLSAYTHTLKYGPYSIPAGPKAPQTMCVAAVAEVIITALNLYIQDTGDDSPTSYLSADGWIRLRPIDIKSHIWVDIHLQSYGTADALSTFGVGHHRPFSQLTPGSFVNLNRTNGSGHAVVFLSFIDKEGRELPTYSSQVAGFIYFSSQGRPGAPGSGFGYRYAFFNTESGRFCPKLDGAKQIDCGIIYSFSQKLLNTGYMLTPKSWDKQYRDENLLKIKENLYQQNYSKGAKGERLPNLKSGLSRDAFMDALERVDTMSINPDYLSENMPEEDAK